MFIALCIAAYLLMGYFTVFLVALIEPGNVWDKGVPWLMALGWPVVWIFILLAAVDWLSKRLSFSSPIALAQRVHEYREERKRVIVKGKRGLEDG